ncbi:MAG: ribonuclease III [Bacteroidales bacterium]|nr:ribonuclease III [Bacteroidales bacterium]
MNFFSDFTFLSCIFFSKNKDYYKSLVKIIGFFPGNIELYKLALTHSSSHIYNSKGIPKNNERLEFLGDAILDAVIADYLYKKFPYENEGFLTKMRSKIVNGEFLSKLADNLGIKELVSLNNKIILINNQLFGNALEALIGAIYIDKGYKTSQKFVINKIIKKYIDINKLKAEETNYKSKLLEWTQKGKHKICFETSQQNNDIKHLPVFLSNIFIDNEISGTGTGASKKEAEQNAAKETIDKIGI